MNRIEAEVRAERDKLALEVANLDRVALRKLLDQWRDERHQQDEPREDPEDKLKLVLTDYKFKVDWDEYDELAQVRADLPLLSPTEAAVRLVTLHDHIFNETGFEAIHTKEWYNSLGIRLQMRVFSFRAVTDGLDWDGLLIFQRCLIYLQEHLARSPEADDGDRENDRLVLEIDVSARTARLQGQVVEFKPSANWDDLKKLGQNPGRLKAMDRARVSRLRKHLEANDLKDVADAIKCEDGKYSLCTAKFAVELIEPQ